MIASSELGNRRCTVVSCSDTKERKKKKKIIKWRRLIHNMTPSIGVLCSGSLSLWLNVDLDTCTTARSLGSPQPDLRSSHSRSYKKACPHVCKNVGVGSSREARIGEDGEAGLGGFNPCIIVEAFSLMVSPLLHHLTRFLA